MVQSLANEAIACSQLYGLLARVFREEPTLELLELIRSSSFRDGLDESATTLLDNLLQDSREKVIETLSIEFTRLFLGPGHHVSPHESIQLGGKTGSLWGEATVAAKCFIEKAGFTLAECSPYLPDHISVELDFLCHLTRLESQSWRNEDLPAIENSLDWQANFYAQHIGIWYSQFCHTIHENHPVAFYRIFTEILSKFLSSEQESIGFRRLALQRCEKG